MNSINAFYNSDVILQRKSFNIKIYIFFLMIFLTLLLAILLSISYHSYINLTAVLVKEQNSYHLRTLVLEEQIENINQENLIINNKKNKYKIKNISEEFILDEKYNRYYEVVLETKIEQDLIINNNIINISIELPKETFFQKLIKKIKKGMKQ
ncbi:MAG: hypothetical protein E7169_02605 [Firmicutes bacterium]|nr:hypothetical protein [Bacillota bacterium]